jgi:probable rRNA maturation factor
MILLDPDLDSGPALTSDGAKQPDGPVSARTPPRFRLPSARTLARFLHQAQAAARLRGEVSVLLTTDGAMRKMNRQFRGKDKATDVLSFPAETPLQNQEKIAGDLAISVERAQKQGTACGHSLETEIKILILHGLLHLSGYDHERDQGEMARREQVLRGRLGLKQGLIERVSSASRRVGKSASQRVSKPAKFHSDLKNKGAAKAGQPLRERPAKSSARGKR